MKGDFGGTSGFEVRAVEPPALEMNVPNMEFAFTLDDERREAITNCLRNGDLRMTLQNARIDVLSGTMRARDVYAWD